MKYQPRSPFYDRLPFGKHQGRYLSELLFHDPEWVMWAKDKHVIQPVFFRKELGQLFERLSSIIIPPAKDPDEARVADYHYASHSRLSFVSTRRASEPVTRHNKIVKTLPELDIAFSCKYRNTRYYRAYDPVISAILQEHFPGQSEPISDDQAIEFFTTPKNFLRGI